MQKDKFTHGRKQLVELYGRHGAAETDKNLRKQFKVLPLLLRNHSLEDTEDLVSYISSRRLNQSFQFVSVDQNPDITHAAQLFSAGSYVLVAIDNLMDLINAHGNIADQHVRQNTKQIKDNDEAVLAHRTFMVLRTRHCQPRLVSFKFEWLCN